MNEETPIEHLNFPQAWRVKRCVKIYNLSKDKPKRITKLGDLRDYKTLDFNGIGPKTEQILNNVLSNLR